MTDIGFSVDRILGVVLFSILTILAFCEWLSEYYGAGREAAWSSTWIFHRLSPLLCALFIVKSIDRYGVFDIYQPNRLYAWLDANYLAGYFCCAAVVLYALSVSKYKLARSAPSPYIKYGLMLLPAQQFVFSNIVILYAVIADVDAPIDILSIPVIAGLVLGVSLLWAVIGPLRSILRSTSGANPELNKSRDKAVRHLNFILFSATIVICIAIGVQTSIVVSNYGQTEKIDPQRFDYVDLLVSLLNVAACALGLWLMWAPFTMQYRSMVVGNSALWTIRITYLHSRYRSAEEEAAFLWLHGVQADLRTLPSQSESNLALETDKLTGELKVRKRGAGGGAVDGGAADAVRVDTLTGDDVTLGHKDKDKRKKKRSSKHHHAETRIVQIKPSDIVWGEVVGEGVAARVYRATWQGAEVAVKQLRHRPVTARVRAKHKRSQPTQFPPSLRISPPQPGGSSIASSSPVKLRSGGAHAPQAQPQSQQQQQQQHHAHDSPLAGAWGASSIATGATSINSHMTAVTPAHATEQNNQWPSTPQSADDGPPRRGSLFLPLPAMPARDPHSHPPTHPPGPLSAVPEASAEASLSSTHPHPSAATAAAAAAAAQYNTVRIHVATAGTGGDATTTATTTTNNTPLPAGLAASGGGGPAGGVAIGAAELTPHHVPLPPTPHTGGGHNVQFADTPAADGHARAFSFASVDGAKLDTDTGGSPSHVSAFSAMTAEYFDRLTARTASAKTVTSDVTTSDSHPSHAAANTVAHPAAAMAGASPPLASSSTRAATTNDHQLYAADALHEEQMFQNEVVINAHMGHHPRVVGFLGASIHKPNFFLVFNFMPYGSLEKLLIHQNALPITPDLPAVELIENLRVVIQMLLDAASGIIHVHSVHAVHRDIAARNFLVDTFHRVTVCDFGMSRILPDNEVCGYVHRDILPLKWCAPETLRYGLFSEKTDVFSFGILLHEVISRGDPYPHHTAHQVADAVWREVDPLRPEIPPHCPTDLAILMRQCWAPNPALRPAVTEIYDSLKYLLVRLTEAGDDDIQIQLAYNPLGEPVGGAGAGQTRWQGPSVAAIQALSSPSHHTGVDAIELAAERKRLHAAEEEEGDDDGEDTDPLEGVYEVYHTQIIETFPQLRTPQARPPATPQAAPLKTFTASPPLHPTTTTLHVPSLALSIHPVNAGSGHTGGNGNNGEVRVVGTGTPGPVSTPAHRRSVLMIAKEFERRASQEAEP